MATARWTCLLRATRNFSPVPHLVSPSFRRFSSNAGLPQTNRLKVNGIELETAVWQPPGGPGPARPTVVMLHESLGSVSIWGPKFPQQLAAATKATVFAWSRAGFGTSQDDGLTIDCQRTNDFLHREALVNLPALLKEAKIERPFLFGHSDGGTIALMFAGGFPDSLAGAAILAPHEWAEDITVAGVRAARKHWEDNPKLFERLAKHHGGSVERARSVFYNWNNVWQRQEFIDSFDIRDELLPKITAPMVVIQGINDEFGSMKQIEVIKEKATESAGIEVLKLEDCGHSPYRDKPEEVCQAVARLMNRIVEGRENERGIWLRYWI